MLAKIIKLWSFLEKRLNNKQILIFQNNYQRGRSSTLLRKPKQKNEKMRKYINKHVKSYKEEG
jgi:hypothetical protein